MSRENVEIVRRVLEAQARGDAAAIFALYDEGIEWDASRTGGAVAGLGVLRGHDGVRTWFRAWYEGFQDVEYEIEELIDAGEHVVAAIGQRGRGRSSGAPVALTLYGAWTVRNGKVVRISWFATRDEALEAVGLREQAMSRENVEAVREMTMRFNRDGFMPEDLFDPDVELSNIRESPLPGPYRGYEGLREWREGVFEVVEQGRFEIDDVIDVDDADLVIFKVRLLVALNTPALRSISAGQP